jgi:hypothetical protein
VGQVSRWDANADVLCLASYGNGLFVSTLTGYAYLAPGWESVCRLDDVPLGLGEVEPQPVMPAGLLKQFVVADLLDESQNQVWRPLHCPSPSPG